MNNNSFNIHPGFVLLSTTVSALFLLGCAITNVLVQGGLLAPAGTPDPYTHHRAILQPFAQTDIETFGPMPQYHITAQLNQAKTALTGVMQVTIPEAQSELIFRLYPAMQNYRGSIEVTQARVNGRPVEVLSLPHNTAIRLNPSTIEPVTAQAPLLVEMAFVTRLPETVPGVDARTLFGWSNSTLSLPGFYPTLAVKQAGEWILDEPPAHGDVLFNDVALYQLDLTLPPDLIAVSSGVVINVIDNEDNSRTWQMTGGPLRDMTVIAGPFQALSESAAGATVTAYYLPGHETGAALALAHATASLRLYSDIYGPYPYTELDVVEAPLGHRGMEYSGLILIGADLYANPRELLTFLVAHEVAHQWWYALVGNNPYQHPWLDEGLTEYSAFDYYRTIYGQSTAEDLLIGRWQVPFNIAAQGGIDGQIDRPAAAFDPISYELLVYGKAALFFNALRQQLGDETYRQVIQTYYAENRYGLTTPQTFLTTAERVSGQDLHSLIEQWLK